MKLNQYEAFGAVQYVQNASKTVSLPFTTNAFHSEF
jgi:hypothetical protein